jgi:hypothetical protein
MMNNPKFKVGDIVKYSKVEPRIWKDPLTGEKTDLTNGYDSFIGNRGVILKVSDGRHIGHEIKYSIHPIDPFPFTAWHTEDTLEIISYAGY